MAIPTWSKLVMRTKGQEEECRRREPQPDQISPKSWLLDENTASGVRGH